MADTVPRRRRPPVAGTEDAPPKDAPPTQANIEEPKLPRSATQIQRKLEAFFARFALMFAAAGDMHCAQLLAKRGPVVASSWAELANESPAVKRAIESLLKGGAWGGAIFSTVSLIVPIAAHHGAPLPDFISPIVLGGEKEKEPEPEEPAPIVYFAGPASNGDTPGPAAVSVNHPDTSVDLTNPDNYPGPHTQPIESD